VRADGLRVHVDVAFTRQRVAVFVDGCFWHSCPQHGRAPGTNPAYWPPKLQANTTRDRRVDAALTSAGWTVRRLWEHEVGPDAAASIEALVRSAGAGDRRTSQR
jgi:DNA mismatch endonuclease (patch repair protein)